MKTRIEKSQRSAPKDGRLSTGTIRTFLAEESPLLMASLARIVSKNERIFIVGAVGDGRKALTFASSLQPALVITDLHIPGLDGAETTRLLKQRPNPPIIFVVTSDDRPEARSRSLAVGADAFLVKSDKFVSRILATIQDFFPADLE